MSRTAIVLNANRVFNNLLKPQLVDRRWTLIEYEINTLNKNDIDRKIDETMEKCRTIDCLILNSSAENHYRASVEEFPIETWQNILYSDVVSNFYLVKRVWPSMQRQHFGRILFIVNNCGPVVSPFKSASIAAYYATVGLSAALAVEGNKLGITSNILYPNKHNRTSDPRFSHLTSLTDLVEFLFSNEANSCSGQWIPWEI